MGCGPLSFVCNAAGGALSKVADAGFGVIAKSFAAAAKTMCEWMWSAISATTRVDLTGDWFKSDVKLTGVLAGVMVAALFVLQVIKGTLRRNPHALGRALTGCGMAFLGAAAAIVVTEALLAVTDALCNGVVHLSGQRDLGSLGTLISPVGVLTTGGLSAALVIALSVFFVIGSVLVWAVFIIRKALIIVAAVFAPVAFGGAPADGTRGWVRRWIEFTLAMIFSKLLVVLIFVIALSLFSHSSGGWTGLSNLMTGLLLLMLASFSPWMVFKLVHFVGGDVAAAHHSSIASDSKAAAGTGAAVATRAKGSAQKVFGGNARAAASSSTSPTSPAGASAAAGAAGAAVATGATAWRTGTAPGRAAATMTDNAPRPEPRQATPDKPTPAPSKPSTRLSANGVDWSEAT